MSEITHQEQVISQELIDHIQVRILNDGYVIFVNDASSGTKMEKQSLQEFLEKNTAPIEWEIYYLFNYIIDSLILDEILMKYCKDLDSIVISVRTLDCERDPEVIDWLEKVLYNRRLKKLEIFGYESLNKQIKEYFHECFDKSSTNFIFYD